MEFTGYKEDACRKGQDLLSTDICLLNSNLFIACTACDYITTMQCIVQYILDWFNESNQFCDIIFFFLFKMPVLCMIKGI